MRNATIFLLLISHYATGQDVNGTWSGSMKMDQYFQGITSTTPGMILCSSNEGKGINANNAYFGNGTHGNCAADLKLK